MANTLYNHTSGVPAAQSRGISSSIRVEFDLVQAGFDLAANKTAETYSGVQNFTGATVTVATPTAANHPATKAYADGLAFLTALPGISLATKGMDVTNDGTTGSWGASAYSSLAILNNIGF